MDIFSVKPGKIQFLPMNQNQHFEHRPIREIQADFIERTLPAEGGRYSYNRPGIKYEPDTLVVFQYDNRLIGAAWLESCAELDHSVDGFTDAYTFVAETIVAIEPITTEELKQDTQWEDFPGYGRERRIIPQDKSIRFMELLTRKRNRYLLNLDEPSLELPDEGLVDSGSNYPA